MNVRSAILNSLADGQKSLTELLKLDYLDRLITRTLNRMARHNRIEEHDGVYALIGKLVKPNKPVEVVEVVQVTDVSAEEAMNMLADAIENVDRTELLNVLDQSVKNVVLTMKTMSMEDILILKKAEQAGKTRKSLIAAIEKLEG